MKILQSGSPKCGNFWLYKIIQQVLKRSGGDTGSFIEQHPVYPLAQTWDLNFPEQCRIDVLEITDLQCRYRISSVFNMPIDDIEAYIAQTNHVWTHSPVCQRSEEVFRLFDKKIYIIRDPRDRALSAAKYYCSDYMQKYFPQPETDPDQFLKKNFARLMQEWVWHVWDHLRLSQSHHIHVAFYEGFNTNFQQELTRLLDYLDVELPDIQKAELKHSTSFESLKEANPKHVKKGKSGHWVEKLTEKQIEEAKIIAGPLIEYLGYPLQKHESPRLNRNYAFGDLDKLKQDIHSAHEVLQS